jgi:hypothetical protein
MEVKRCPDCGEVKPAFEFGRNRSLGDGLSFYCLDCNRARSNEHYRKRRAALGKTVRDLSWVPDGFRWCPTCQQAVPIEDYIRNSGTRSGFGTRCKPCHNAMSKAAYWVRRYGISRQDVDLIRAKQRNRCAICGDENPEHLDHDHSTGRTRDLLCQRCNQGLGLLRDDPGILRAAADYVEEHRRRQRRPQPLRTRPAQVTARPISRRDGLRVWRVRHHELLSDRSWADLTALLQDA